MSNEAEIAKLLQTYFLAYPNSSMPKESWAFYVRALIPLPIELIEAAMMMLVTKSKYFPAIAEIFDAAKSIMSTLEKQRPTPTEAWKEVMTLARTRHLYKPWEYSCDEVREAVEAFGKRELCMIEESTVGVARAQFMRMYSEILRTNSEKRESLEILKALQNDGKNIGGKIIQLAEAKRATA